jgi:flagellar hook assembly protein FlgD
MKKTISNWLKNATISTLISLLLGAPFTALAETLPNVQITENTVTQDTIYPNEGETFTINYCINTTAYVTAGIYRAQGSNSSEKVDILEDYTEKPSGCYTLSWDGENGSQSEIGTTGEIVEDGQYFYGIRAQGVPDKSCGDIYVAQWINVKTQDETDLKIIDVDVENSIFDPYDDQEVEFTFTINQGAYMTLKIYDEDNDKVATVIDEKFYKKGEYTVDWDGEDKSGDLVDQGDYTYKLTAEYGDEKDKEKGDLIVKKDYEIDESTEDPRLKRVFATKETFDPGRNETTNVVFTLTAQADVTVKIYNEQGEKIEKILDSDNLEKGTYMAEWDGDGYEDEEGEFTYKIYAKNSKGEDLATGEIEIEEDEKYLKKPNVFKDKTDPVIYKPKNQDIEFSFKLDRDAEVTIEIRDEDYYVIAKVIDEKDMSEGSHTVKWDGIDKNGDYADNGVYTYKLIAENKKGKDVEKGNFEIQETGNAKNPQGRCGTFSDVTDTYKYCEAIEWAKSKDIFEGYSDGTFKPNQAINRVEALKVILETMEVSILSSSGENLGFPDVDRYGWYMPYLKTALSLGIVSGYPDGTFRPNDPVNRVEALVMLLNTGRVKNGLIIPTNLYGQPFFDTPNAPDTKWYLSYAWFAQSYDLTDSEYYLFPADYMSRGEMADMLYRYYENVL